ncbi:MAG: VWA domain-containing protein [Planctomycetota bacterium]
MLTIGCLWLCLLSSPIDEAEDAALSEFRKDWRQAFAEEQFERLGGFVDKLSTFDSPDTAKALLELFEVIESQALEIEVQRRKYLLEAKGSAISRLRAQLDPMRVAQEKILSRISRFREPETWKSLADVVLDDDKKPLQLRLAVMYRAVAQPGLQEPLERAFRKARDAGELVSFLDSFSQAEVKLSERVVEKIVDLIDHKDPSVREQAARLSARLALPAAIEPLIERLESEEGRTQKRFAASLEVLTRQPLGTSVTAWQRWFEENGELAAQGALPLGGGSSGAEVDSRYGTYHGIPQEGRSIVYVIDCSGSMREAVTSGGRGRGRGSFAPGEPAKEGETSRIDACRRELIRALEQLDPETQFNIVQYANVAEVYSKKMVTASPKQVERAKKWIESLQADGATNIYDAMELAFTLAGRGTFDRYYETAVDTVFLLTDGKPMLPGSNGRGEWDSTDRILEGVLRWNPHGRVVVHTVGIGRGVNRDFLQDMAKQNGGKFSQQN